MIKNVIIKKILKNSIFKVITEVNRLIPKNDNWIMLYMGNKGISFNNEAILSYLIENGYDEKYKIFCAVEKEEYYGESLNNIHYITQKKAIVKYLRTKHVFYTAGQLPIKPSKSQIVIHMNHGVTDYKTMGALTKIANGDEFFFTYMIATAPIYVPITAAAYKCAKKNVQICGEPMLDRIFSPKKIYEFDGFKRTLLWLPTFRQSDYLGYDDSEYSELLPLFANNDYDELNSYLLDKDCQLIVKLHPSQSDSEYIHKKYSNLKIYTHEMFQKEKLNIYDLMASVDGLIGDYSSASLQFLLTNKPLAYVIPDIEEYRQKRGFVFDNPTQYMPGHLIYTKTDFWKFIDEFSSDVDPYAEEREKIKNIIHMYQDGNSSRRVLELSNITIE